MANSTDDQIESFVEFTGADRKTADLFLQGNVSLEAAMNAFFEDPDPRRFKQQTSWTEKSWNTDRDGGATQVENTPPFQMDVENVDEDERTPRSLRHRGAPSRPPSRERSRMSLRSGRDVEMQYGPHLEDNDADMREALRLSLETNHQNGVLDASGNEYVPDLAAEERKRHNGQPSFFKPLPSNTFLPSLITILHSVPQLRETLMSRDDMLADYGRNVHWWQGDAIEITRIIHIDEEQDEPSAHMAVVHETQRLMAFLTATERSYGSVQALSHLTAFAQHGEDPAFVRFLVAWQDAAAKLKTAHSISAPFESTVKSIGDFTHVTIPALRIPRVSGATLYDALDNFFWADDPPEVFLDQIAPVVVMHLNPGTVGQLEIKVPSIFWADRYHSSNKELVTNMREQVEGERESVAKLEQKTKKLEQFGKPGGVETLFNSAIAHLDRRVASEHNHDGTTNISDDKSTNSNEASTTISASQALARLQAINAQLRASVNSIKAEKENMQAKLRKISGLLTDPADEMFVPTQKYLLSGVSVSDLSQSYTTYTTFVKYRRPLGIEEEDPKSDAFTWWRMSYVAGDTALVTKDQVDEETVLKSAGELLSETLLVYAQEDLWEASTQGMWSVPTPLDKFVKADNQTFQEELEDTPQIIWGQAVDSTEALMLDDPESSGALLNARMMSEPSNDPPIMDPSMMGGMELEKMVQVRGADAKDDSETPTLVDDDGDHYMDAEMANMG